MNYITKISLRNIKCLPSKVDIDIPVPNETRPSWTLFFGDNGTGKTSILRCIAMGLCDETSASGLSLELETSMINNESDTATIEIHLTNSSAPNSSYSIKTTLKRIDPTSDSISNSKPNTLNGNLFACGYGASSRVLGTESFQQYRLINAVYTLFNYEARLQNPETVLFRISEGLRDKGLNKDDLLRKFDRILMLPDGSTTLDSNGLRVGGFWGESVPAQGLGDGYAATLSWVSDLLSWKLLHEKEQFDDHVRGIVLLDEIEQHLHPAWQREIVPRLSDEFPQVQFIGTSHAPLIATGAASLPDDCCQLVRLSQDRNNHQVLVHPDQSSPQSQRADQVLTSELFGLTTTTSDTLIQKIEEYTRLKGLPNLNSDQTQQVEDLERELNNVFGAPETALQRFVGKAIDKVLDTMVNQSQFAPKAVSFEARRQLRRLLSEEDS